MQWAADGCQLLVGTKSCSKEHPPFCVQLSQTCHVKRIQSDGQLFMRDPKSYFDSWLLSKSSLGRSACALTPTSPGSKKGWPEWEWNKSARFSIASQTKLKIRPNRLRLRQIPWNANECGPCVPMLQNIQNGPSISNVVLVWVSCLLLFAQIWTRGAWSPVAV
jgi:hypothetical protein